MKKKISLLGLIGITIAFFGSVRSVPMIAATGWQQIFYMLVAGLLFALPIALLSAELSTLWENDGGPQAWVSDALGEKWGFLTAWLLWLQMFFGMVMVSMTFSVMLGDMLGIDALEHNNVLICFVIIGVWWLITLLNVKFDMVRVVGNYGTIIGVYIPFVILVVLGVAYFIKNGISPQGYLADFSASKLLPNFGDIGTLPVFVGIVFLFAGVEMSSVHVKQIENPKKNYPIAVISAVLILIVLNLGAALGMANAMPAGQVELSNVMSAITIYLKDFGWPSIIYNIMAGFVLVGVFTALSAWVLGPSKSMLHVAKQGALPKFFQKQDKKGDPINLVLVQAVMVSLIACLFLLPIDVNSIFLVITVTTTLLYCLVYVMIILSAMRLRKTMPDAPRAFRLGEKGNGLLYALSIITLVIIAIVVFSSFIPPSGIPQKDTIGYILLQLGAVALAVGSGLLINKFKKPEWKQPEDSKNEVAAK